MEVIRELEASGREPTATAVRELLGSGSYTTIAAVLADWRREKASKTKAPTLEPPDTVRHLMTHLWAEAWRAALGIHEPERQAFARERQEHERAKAELLAEIARLEGELEAEKEQTASMRKDLDGKMKILTDERDRCRDEAQAARAAQAAAEGALSEARKQVEREAERSAHLEERNREISERVIAEAAKAQALTARVEEPRGPS